MELYKKIVKRKKFKIFWRESLSLNERDGFIDVAETPIVNVFVSIILTILVVFFWLYWVFFKREIYYKKYSKG